MYDIVIMLNSWHQIGITNLVLSKFAKLGPVSTESISEHNKLNLFSTQGLFVFYPELAVLSVDNSQNFGKTAAIINKSKSRRGRTLHSHFTLSTEMAEICTKKKLTTHYLKGMISKFLLMQ